MLSLGDELQGLYVSEEIVFLGPAVHIVSHLVGTEVRDQYLFGSNDKLEAAKPFKVF